MPRFAASESQQLVLGLVLVCVIPLLWLVGTALAARGRAGLIERVGAAHRFAAWAAGRLVAPTLAVELLVLLWAVADQSRAFNLTLVGAVAGAVGAVLFGVVLFGAYVAGLFPYHPAHPLGRLLGGFTAAPRSVALLGWTALAFLGVALGVGYGTQIGNSEWWHGLWAAGAVFALGALVPALLLAGGGPLNLGRGPGPLLSLVVASTVFGLTVGVMVANFGVTRGLLVATIFAGG